jgi:hypothetical protein
LRGCGTRRTGHRIFAHLAIFGDILTFVFLPGDRATMAMNAKDLSFAFEGDRVYRHLLSQCQLLQIRGANRGRTFLQVIESRCPSSPKIRHAKVTVSLRESLAEAAAKGFRDFHLSRA